MADFVRLSVVIDTQRAAANMVALDRQYTASAISARKAGLAALTLAQSLETGSISAVGMAKSLGNVATMIFGPWGIALALAVGVLTLFANNAKKAREEQRKLADEMRTLTRTVDLLLRPSQKQSDFGTEIQRLTDLIHDLDEAIKDSNESWNTLLQGGLATALLTIPGMGGLGAALMPKAPSEAAKRGAVAGQLGRLLAPGAEANAELDRYNKLVEQQGRILAALNAGPFVAADTNLTLLREHLEKLAGIEGPEAALAFEQTAAAIRTATESLYQMERRFKLLENAFHTMSDALEDFVVTGTLAFTDFLNNIIRLLLRDISGNIFHDIAMSFGRRGGGNVDVGPASFGDPLAPGYNPSVMAPVTFNVFAYDSQDTARWIQQNGARIAAEVAGHAERSSGLRRKFARG